MRKKLFMTMVLIMSIFLSGSAYEKASNKYAKEAKHIMLVAQGYSGENSGERCDSIMISIIGFKTNSWDITIRVEDKTILSGTFAITNAYNFNTVTFTEVGINKETKEEVQIHITSHDQDAYLTVWSPIEGKKLDIPYNTFYVRKDNPKTKIYFHSVDWGEHAFNPTIPFWKEGTAKQLKKCLSENPYLRKI